jgi:hypothetical protein
MNTNYLIIAACVLHIATIAYGWTAIQLRHRRLVARVLWGIEGDRS